MAKEVRKRPSILGWLEATDTYRVVSIATQNTILLKKRFIKLNKRLNRALFSFWYTQGFG